MEISEATLLILQYYNVRATARAPTDTHTHSTLQKIIILDELQL